MHRSATRNTVVFVLRGHELRAATRRQQLPREKMRREHLRQHQNSIGEMPMVDSASIS
jgi:hypothetical protein